MPRQKQHRKLGGGIGVAIGFAAANRISQNQPGSVPDLLLYCGLGLAGGLVGSILPDLLEPPRHPNHRGVFHSIVPTALGVTVLVATAFPSVGTGWAGTFLSAGAAGYVSHILADAGTPAGVPILPRSSLRLVNQTKRRRLTRTTI